MKWHKVYIRNFKFITIYIGSLILFCMGCKDEEEENEKNSKRPNIVIFISDDQGYDDSGVYGNEVVKTPNIDNLAEDGITFTNAFAASPLSSPSRCVIETGLMPFRNGGHKFGTPIREEVKTMPEYFNELGYYTAEIGKFHHPPRDQNL